jgi:hypothetical protein
VKLDQLTKWVAAERRPESLVDEVLPRWLAMIPFEHRVPLSGIAGHAEDGEEDFPHLWCLLNPEELVTPVKPRKGVFRTIEGQEK